MNGNSHGNIKVSIAFWCYLFQNTAAIIGEEYFFTNQIIYSAGALIDEPFAFMTHDVGVCL